MNKINLEFTSQHAGVLIPFFNNELGWIYEWAELTYSDVDYKEVKFLEEALVLLRDSVHMDLDVVLTVEDKVKNTLIRLSSNLALIRERTKSVKEFEVYDRIIEIISNGYKMLGAEV